MTSLAQASYQPCRSPRTWEAGLTCHEQRAATPGRNTAPLLGLQDGGTALTEISSLCWWLYMGFLGLSSELSGAPRTGNDSKIFLLTS